MSENKKDSFTFSDKIKNSKPAFNPFSKRASKIGSNGKPKKTLFERTRRDAPFLVAGAAALLMLPFLYQYSGTVDDGTSVTPGLVQDDFTPERFAYDPGMGDGEIAQVTGLDPMSLIKRLGEEEPTRQAAMHDDIDDYVPPSRPSRQPVTPTYRKEAPAATRAAFQRTPNPTKINELRGASLNARGGGGIGSRFGGANLKAAARENSGPAPKSGTKPVSLTPLRGAANPSRSYFGGQGSAAQARASREAMGKADATLAIKDALYSPIENRKLGGLGDGVFAAGGGSGPMNRTFSAKPLQPWWFDMMKQQEMEKWKWKYFLFRKPLADGIAKIIGDLFGWLSGYLSCWATGTDDWSMGKGGPQPATPGTPGGCKVFGEDANFITMEEYCSTHATELACKSEDAFKNTCKNGGFDGNDKNKWVDGEPGHGALSRWGVRRNCIDGYQGKFEGITRAVAAYGCDKLIINKTFKVVGEGKAAKWKHAYHAVIVENMEIEDSLGNKKPLCSPYVYQNKGRAVSGGGDTDMRSRKGNKYKLEREVLDQNGEYRGDVVQTAYAKRVYTRAYRPNGTQVDLTPGEPGRAIISPNDLGDAYSEIGSGVYGGCVIYVAKGDTFNHALYERDVTTVLDRETGGKGKEIFAKLHPIMIEGYIMKNKMANGRYGLPPMDVMPMQFADFMNLYVEEPVSDGKAVKKACPWAGFNITANSIVRPLDIEADLAFDSKYKPSDDIEVIVNIYKEEGGTPEITFGVDSYPALLPVGPCPGRVCHYKLGQAQAEEFASLFNGATKDNPITKRVEWVATDKNDPTKVSHSETTYSTKKPIPVEPYDPGKQPQCSTDKRQTIAGTNCTITVPCVEGEYKFEDMTQSEGCRDGSLDGKTFLTLARSMATVAATKDKMTFKTSLMGAWTEPSGTDVLYQKFNSQDDLVKLNAAAADTSTTTAAYDYVKSVIDAFHADPTNADKVLLDNVPEAVPAAQFVDALNLALQMNQNAKVSKAAVCSFARGIGHVSRAKKANSNMHNYFGAVAIYVGVDSAYYPSGQIQRNDNGGVVEDDRFRKAPYRWTRYLFDQYHCIDSKARGMIEAARVETPNGDIYPLAALFDGDPRVSPIPVCKQEQDPSAPLWESGKIAENYREIYRQTYRKILFEGTGQCETLQGEMNVANALAYMKKVIELGLDYQPENNNIQDGTGRLNMSRYGYGVDPS